MLPSAGSIAQFRNNLSVCFSNSGALELAHGGALVRAILVAYVRVGPGVVLVDDDGEARVGRGVPGVHVVAVEVVEPVLRAVGLPGQSHPVARPVRAPHAHVVEEGYPGLLWPTFVAPK